jgi:predicted transcriptional regulator
VERLHKLLFELSSAERINIMQELQKNELKLSHLSKKLDLTVTETSRHLQRLNDTKLIQKNPAGQYRLTPYGNLVLSQLSGLDFITKHQKYVLEYDLSCLPYKFVNRIGELEEAVFGSDIYGNLDMMAKELQRAKEFVWILSDQIIDSLVAIMLKKVDKNFDFRFIAPEAIMPSDKSAPMPSTMPGVQKKVLPKVEFIIAVTEQAAAICLPRQGGPMDYRNINGTSPMFREWCKDLFLHYWESAKPVGEMNEKKE